MTPLCRLCARPARGNAVTPGPTLGKVHRACFIVWDREQEALELEFGRGFHLPDPMASRTDIELEPDRSSADAA